MTYQQIDQIMLAKSLASDPSFDDLRIGIEPIRCYNGCPLGLYFPVTEWSPYIQQVVPAKTIIIPPEASEAALLHELGHRHGHYYYNDLSEYYAENFRKAYQTEGRALLYAGNHFNRLPEFGVLFEEGERGAVEIALAYPLAPDTLDEVRNRLSSYGDQFRVCYGDGDIPFMRVEFTKGVDWLTIVGASLAGLATLTVGIIGYAIYKVSADMPWVTPVLVFGIPATLLLGLALGAKYAPQLKKTFPALVS